MSAKIYQFDPQQKNKSRTDHKQKKLQAHFAETSKPVFKAQEHRSAKSKTPKWNRQQISSSIVIAAILMGAMGWSLWNAHPRSVSEALRHLASAPNCNAARSMGLAPALRGSPGYYPSHDADHDGIACEPLPVHK